MVQSSLQAAVSMQVDLLCHRRMEMRQERLMRGSASADEDRRAARLLVSAESRLARSAQAVEQKARAAAEVGMNQVLGNSSQYSWTARCTVLWLPTDV
jgi:hypothetical protein